MTLEGSLLVVLALLPGRVQTFNMPVRNARESPSGRRSIRAEVRAVADDDSASLTKDEVEAIGIHIPSGLRQTLIKNAHDAISKRFWIVDNSGSMILEDGHSTLVDHGDHTNTCTRWDEVSETVFCHTQLAAALGAPTNFRLLNPPNSQLAAALGAPTNFRLLNPPKNGGSLIRGPQSFSVGYGLNTPKQAAKDCRRANSIMVRNGPTGRTPLTASFREVRQDIVNMLPELEARGSKACIVVATDGCNYDAQSAGLEMNEEERNRDLVQALESLRGLPVRLVVRLCTDYEPVVNFYNDLDQCLDIDIDVLDDHVAEAQEVHRHNPWLNYALVLHRMREMGQDCHLIDLLDERSFTREEIREFCALLFGNSTLLRYDWERFLQEVDLVQQKERNQYNPITKLMTPWIDIRLLALIDEV